MMNDISRRSVLFGLSSALFPQLARAQAPQVTCALVLAVDVSSSIDGEHWWLQRKGYAEALSHPEVISAIQNSIHRQIAINYFEWSGTAFQREIIPWTIIDSAESGEEVADTLTSGRRPFEGSTGLGSAIRYSLARLDSCPFSALNKVIDVSGDGANNDGPTPESIRDEAASHRIRINGLPIQWSRSHPPSNMTIQDYYRNSVIGGPNGFCMEATGFDTFAYALAAKLRAEIT